ncbi:MAG TPA: glycosyltransferase family 2 protein [Vicinamibacterales bacterium]
MTRPHISAVLVNYNAGLELRRALRSIADELAGREWEAVVIDNASSDGIGAVVEELAPKARLLRNDENVGFARGMNQALAATTGPLVLIMNPDCHLVAGAVGVMNAELERSPGCAIVGPRILDRDGSLQGSARGDPDMFTGLFGRTSLLRRVFPALAVSRRNVISDVAGLNGNSSMTVDWLSGACMLARRDALEAVHGFDERYFLYWEDADLCRRLRARGYHVKYVPTATAVHTVAQSSKSVRPLAIRAFHHSAYLYYETHVAPDSGLKRLLARVLLAARCWLQLRFVGSKQ